MFWSKVAEFSSLDARRVLANVSHQHRGAQISDDIVVHEFTDGGFFVLQKIEHTRGFLQIAYGKYNGICSTHDEFILSAASITSLVIQCIGQLRFFEKLVFSSVLEVKILDEPAIRAEFAEPLLRTFPNLCGLIFGVTLWRLMTIPKLNFTCTLPGYVLKIPTLLDELRECPSLVPIIWHLFEDGIMISGLVKDPTLSYLTTCRLVGNSLFLTGSEERKGILVGILEYGFDNQHDGLLEEANEFAIFSTLIIIGNHKVKVPKTCRTLMINGKFKSIEKYPSVKNFSYNMDLELPIADIFPNVEHLQIDGIGGDASLKSLKSLEIFGEFEKIYVKNVDHLIIHHRASVSLCLETATLLVNGGKCSILNADDPPKCQRVVNSNVISGKLVTRILSNNSNQFFDSRDVSRELTIVDDGLILCKKDDSKYIGRLKHVIAHLF